MLEVIHYDEEKCELHTVVNGSGAVLTFDPQSPTAGIWKLIFKAIAEDTVAEHRGIQVE